MLLFWILPSPTLCCPSWAGLGGGRFPHQSLERVDRGPETLLSSQGCSSSRPSKGTPTPTALGTPPGTRFPRCREGKKLAEEIVLRKEMLQAGRAHPGGRRGSCGILAAFPLHLRVSLLATATCRPCPEVLDRKKGREKQHLQLTWEQSPSCTSAWINPEPPHQGLETAGCESQLGIHTIFPSRPPSILLLCP